MKSITIGMAYDPKNVSVMEDQTLAEVYEEAGLSHLLAGDKSINVNGSKPVARVKDKTISELAIKDGDYVIVTDNLKAAR